ncbi:hypothetical protein GPECTOR_5g355 [Gonium pectorale]|uniref:J domain-containing protein n=1 Tax=Gonium pectorale TaxID=33097 RepID=A0A150GWJ1_GONPE|nr:hypothetical protein GPECTOR_5g355 [Gonium pectorale]|eukprot:KXZ54266.1 hypothetical protein GPECTOR_5g355 [Gonium pectorale]
MDITPQGSIASSMASAASNVFVFSPLVGPGMGGQAIRVKRSADEKKLYGNQKYEQGDFRSAERWYTEAIEALEQQLPLPREKLKQLFPTLQTEIAVLYSNRSGARLMTSKPQSALDDALKAMELDSKFMRAASRAATCHCRLGDFAAAHRIIDSAMDRCSASSSHYQDMLKKMNEVVDLASRARAATAAAVAAVASGARDKLQEAADQLSALRDQVAYCDVIAASRAVLALRLGSPREALTLVAPHPEVPLAQRAAPWRLWLTVQARYYRGDMQAGTANGNGAGADDASSEKATSSPGGSAAAAAYATSAHVTVPPPEVLGELAESIQQQLKLKEEGNVAIKAGRHSEATEHYTRALALGCPPAYAAVLHANRAAAYTGQGLLAEAVADCGRARALDPSYYKASVRLASLMMELRRPENAVGLLDPLLKLNAQADGAGPALDELAAIKDRLSEARTAAKWMKTPQHYKMLGLTSACSEEDVRKAYRRLALKHHPDKATASVKVALALPCGAGSAPYSGPLAGGSELETRMREEAAWLFNLINQAHEELSDKSRRRKVDQLLEVEQPPTTTRYPGAGASASNPYASWFSSSSRYGAAYSGFYGGADPFFGYRAPGPAPTAGSGTRARTGTAAGSGTSTTYGGE